MIDPVYLRSLVHRVNLTAPPLTADQARRIVDVLCGEDPEITIPKQPGSGRASSGRSGTRVSRTRS